MCGQSEIAGEDMDLEKEVVKFGREDCGICGNSNSAHLTNTIFLFSFSDVDNRFSKCLFAAPRLSALSTCTSL